MAYGSFESNTTRAGLCGLALVAALLAMLVGIGAGPTSASASSLEPCEAAGPGGPTVELEGQLYLSPVKQTRKAWKRSGLLQKLVKPANNLTGRPTFPVGSVDYTGSAKVELDGGLKISRRGRNVLVSQLQVVTAAGKPAWVRAKVAGRTINFLKVKGGKRTFAVETGELSRVGNSQLTAPAAKLLNRKLRTGKKKLKAGTPWGYFNLYSLYKITEADNPAAEIPEEPPVKQPPLGSNEVTSAATIKWFVRDTFVNYVSSGDGVSVDGGATGDAPTGPNNLVYSFNFPFASGWTVPGDVDGPESTLIKGTGTVGFRYCKNTINFRVSDPEIEIDGDANSRIIFRVNGTDGTPFPDSRAVMIKLMPSFGDPPTVTDNGNGTTTVKYEKIPGFVPNEATGVFAGFYPGYSPDFAGQEPRPDRFGFLSVTYTYATGSS